MPNSRHSAVDVSPVCSESRRASRAASLVISVRKLGQSARSTSPATGTAIRPNPTTAGTHTGHGRACPAEPVRVLGRAVTRGGARHLSWNPAWVSAASPWGPVTNRIQLSARSAFWLPVTAPMR